MRVDEKFNNCKKIKKKNFGLDEATLLPRAVDMRGPVPPAKLSCLYLNFAVT
jgi:hypothetical protein